MFRQATSNILSINALLDANADWKLDRKIPNFTDSERLKTPKTDCLLKAKKSISLDSRLVDLGNTRATYVFHSLVPRPSHCPVKNWTVGRPGNEVIPQVINNWMVGRPGNEAMYFMQMHT